MTLADLLPLAQRRIGPHASVRLTLCAGGTYVATAWRSTTMGRGAEEAACECAATEAQALDALAERLRRAV